MNGQIHIPAPRMTLDLLAKPSYFWVVPCTDGEHEILVSVVLALYDGRPRWFPAVCGRNVWPASEAHPVESDERCGDCRRHRKAMSPEPMDWGPAEGLMYVLARRLARDDAPRAPRNAGPGGNDEDPL